MLQQTLQKALALHQAGRFAEAERLYLQVRTAQPGNFDALHLSGALAYQQSRYKEALDLFKRALRVNPRSATCEMRLGLTLAALGNHEAARVHLVNATKADPASIESWTGLATTLRVLGHLPEAIACYEKVVQLDPKAAQAHDQIGALTADLKGLAAGLPHFERAVTLQPKFAPGWCNRGLALLADERFAEALDSFSRALTIDPKLVQAKVGRALAFQQTYRLEKAAAEYAAALAAQPDHHQARSGRLLTLNYNSEISREELFAEHLAFGRIAEANSVSPPPSFPRQPDPDRRLRVAFLSPDLRAHSVAYFLEPLLQQIDPGEIEIVLYHDHFKVDAVSERLRALASIWRNFSGQLNSVVEAAIRSDAPDILIDLAGHTGLNRLPLFARRLAPVQISYLGYPNTTGLRSMDYRLVDPVTDPVGEAEAFHTEKLVRFSRCAWSYQPPAIAPDCNRTGPEALTFGSFNNLAKLSDDTLRVWSRVLAATADSRLLLKGHGAGDAGVSTFLLERMQAAGLDIGRVDLAPRLPQLKDHLGLYQRVDVALDTFPYAGTTTTCEALWMGVPVVSLCGQRHAARVGASLLTAVGRTEWIADTADRYVEIATALMADRKSNPSARGELRSAMQQSCLLDHAGQAKAFTTALRECWRERACRPDSAEVAR